MKLKTKLSNTVRSLSGTLIALGIKEEWLLDEIASNTHISACTILSDLSLSGVGEKEAIKQGKSINIRHLRKKWKYKKIDYIFGRLEEIDAYLKYFIKDSIYISKHKIYLYTEKKAETLDFIISRYKRYNVIISIEKMDTGLLLIIENKDKKRNYIKDCFYLIIDTITSWLDIGSDLLSS